MLPQKWAWTQKKKAKEMGKLHGSILKGAGNFAGFVGEFAAAQALGATVENTLNYDLTWRGVTIDVKTKQSDYTPKGDYEASVADYNPTQKCDFYLFTRFSRKNWQVHILGFYRQNLYVADATFYGRGEIDPANNFLVKADMHNLRHDRLIGWNANTTEQLISAWEEEFADI